MEENEENAADVPNAPKAQEIFARAQETQADRRFPTKSSGIVPVPRGSKGPRSLYLRRYGDSFGFTLRHFIVYPPESVAEDDGRHAACGALLAPMDTIFVKSVRQGTPAEQAGLQKGDRVLAVNGEPTAGRTYQQVVQLIFNSPEYLHLLVVPKEEDVLQRFFPDTAYNPASNQDSVCPEVPVDRASAQKILSKRIGQKVAAAVPSQEFRVDAASWRQLQQQPFLYYDHQYQRPFYHQVAPVHQTYVRPGHHQRSVESVLDPRVVRGQEIYAEIRHPNEVHLRQKSRAQPQVPLYRKMGRRASEGCNLGSNADYDGGAVSLTYSDGDSEYYADSNMKTVQKPRYLPSSNVVSTGDGLNAMGVADATNCLLQGNEATRRESASSLSSSIADSSKDSLLSSFGSNSTLTGHDIDDSERISRVRQSVRQKEEFLRTPVFREFHGRPKKLERPMWPPPNAAPNATQQQVRREEYEEETGGAVAKTATPAADACSPQYRKAHRDDVREGETAPSFEDGDASASETAKQAAAAEERRMNPPQPNFQNVQKKAKEFENYPEDSRMDFSRSELARLSKKVLLPNVTERAQEYESKRTSGGEGTRKEPQIENVAPPAASTSNSVLKRIQKDSRSLDSSDIQSSNDTRQFRARSNSAESWTTAVGDKANHEPVVVKRRIKNKFGKDERTRRPDSYLKATKNEQASFGSDLSDYEDCSPQVLRNGTGSGNSSSSVSLDREKSSVSPVPFKEDKSGVQREGPVNCKVLEIDGKRAADRSWKQMTMVLRGSKLHLFKDRHHPSPLGSSDISLDQSFAAGVDMRSTSVRVAEEYTKRKNVLRVSTVKPCRSELLIQVETREDFNDWVKTLQEQVAVSAETDLDQAYNNRQQAVPQAQPSSTTVQVPGSHLSPLPCAKNGKASMPNRNRSPTGQSPVSKTRKPSTQQDVLLSATSPKSKTWRGRMAKQFKKFNQGANSPSSTAPEVSTFGVPIEHCIASNQNSYLPRFVEVCTEIIDEKGLQVVGIYRVPGNNASITALSEEINRNFDEVPLEDHRWNDLHVVSSLLKSFLRKMPDSLVTTALYPQFINSDKIEDPKARLEALRKLVRSLPKHNYHTLKHVIMHLKRVADNSEYNKMEAKNLAIVFGPTIVRPEMETMEGLVTNMNNQCKIVESLITNAEWFFSEDETEPPAVPLAVPDSCDDAEPNNQALYKALNNIGKFEAFKEPTKEKNVLISSLVTAAHRVMRKPSRSHHQHESNRDEPTTPTGSKSFAQYSSGGDCAKIPEDVTDSAKTTNTIPTTVMEIERRDRSKAIPNEKNPWFNYKTDQSDFSRRIQNFKQETEAMLQRPRMTEISVGNVEGRSGLSSSASNVNTAPRLSLKPYQDFQLTKTHSATNVFNARSAQTGGNRNSLSSVQYNSGEVTTSRHSYGSATNTKQSAMGDMSNDSKGSRYGMRRGSSVENVNSSTLDLNANGGLKKIKYENENDPQRRGSLDSLHKIPTDDESLLSAMTKLIDQKLKEKPPKDDIIPYVDESPEKPLAIETSPATADKEKKSKTSDLYKNPSLHKSQYPTSRTSNEENLALKESKDDEKEKEEDTRAFEDDVPDNDKHISVTAFANNKVHIGSALKRSESLNKPERTNSPSTTVKVKRSESLNKTGDKLKRSDSLSKTEKTESNINKRRELIASGRKTKESMKNKRKNGMPDRSIKRRHTVGGTKDPDKVTYMNKNQNENNPNADNDNEEKAIRTSSPDLSSTRRERFLFEINLIGPENMVFAWRQQHLIGSRPQSFPESNVFKVPLESHV